MEKKIGVYIIHDKDTMKNYVGSSSDLDRRLREHESALRRNVHKNKQLQEVFNRSGQTKLEPRFEFKAIPKNTVEDALDAEQEILDKYMPDGVLYNQAIDARCSFIGRVKSAEEIEKTRIANTGRVKSAEEIEKIRDGNIGKKLTQDHIEKIIIANTGRVHTAEAIEKMRIAATGRIHTLESIEKMRISSVGKNTGKKHTAETIEKLSIIATNRGVPSETIEKARIANTGRVASAETIEKMRIAWVTRKKQKKMDIS